MIHIMVALPCEAKPLVSHFRLKRLLDVQPFAMYENAREGVSLTVSGVGKAAMAAAVAYRAALQSTDAQAVWLNVGVAGSRDAPIGAAFVAEKISDGDSGRCWYPPQIADFPCPGAEIHTVSKPETRYCRDGLYDMEATAFFETAARFSSGELIQCLKVVSDNAAAPAARVTPARVERLLEQTAAHVQGLREALEPLAKELALDPCPDLADYAARWRFTAQERARLETLLRRWRLLDAAGPPPPAHLPPMDKSKQVLDWLAARLDALPVHLTDSLGASAPPATVP